MQLLVLHYFNTLPIRSGGKHFGIPNFSMLLFGKVDIDLYNDLGEKVPVEGMSVDIQIIIPRMKEKDPLAVSFDPCEIRVIQFGE